MGDGQASRVGSMFGPYHLKRLLGRGGMGEVYEAEHTVKEWTVAVKLMSDTFSRDPVSQANNVIVDINACATTSAIRWPDHRQDRRQNRQRIARLLARLGCAKPKQHCSIGLRLKIRPLRAQVIYLRHRAA